MKELKQKFLSNYEEVKDLLPTNKTTEEEIKKLSLAFDSLINLLINYELDKDIYGQAYDVYFKVCLLINTKAFYNNQEPFANANVGKEFRRLRETMRNFNYCLKPMLIEELDGTLIKKMYYEDAIAIAELLKLNKVNDLLIIKVLKLLEELDILIYLDALNENNYFAVNQTLHIAKYIKQELDKRDNDYLKEYLNRILKDLSFRGVVIENYPLRASTLMKKL